MINLFQPSAGKEEAVTLESVLKSNWPGKGKLVAQFEAKWAQHVGVPAENMVSTNSCTSALFEAVRLAGVGPGDEVIIPTVHFVGAAQAVLAAGGTPVFCDVDRFSLNAPDETVDAKITPRTKAIILNHYGGGSPAFEREVFPGIVIDDLACAPTAKITDLDTDYAAWSFDSMKIITTGDGGMLYVRDPERAAEARQDFYLGTSSGSGLNSPNQNQWWEFTVERPGRGRHLMNDLQAALGLVQLEKLPELIARRQAVKFQYLADERINVLALGGQEQVDSLYLFWIFTKRRDELARYLRDKGFYTSFRYWPLHKAFDTGDILPESEWAAQHVLNLPLHAGLSEADVRHICEQVRAFFA